MASPERARGPRDRAHRFALRAAVLYLAFGAGWVLGTDRVVDVLTDGHLEDLLGTFKALTFMLLSAVAVFLAVRRYGRVAEAAENEVRASAAALRVSESRYRSLVERVPGVVYLNSVDALDSERCVYVGPQLRDLLGYDPREWIQDPDLWLRVVHPDDRERVLAENVRASRADDFRVEYRAVHRDGTIVWLHDEAVRVTDGDEASLWQGLMVDITAQRAADSALYALTESLRGVFRASPVPIMVIERSGNVRHWNPAAERLFGWTSEEVLGRPIPHRPEDGGEELGDRLAPVFAGNAISDLDVECANRDGRRLVASVSAAPLRDAAGEVEAVVAVLEDVTERRRVSAEAAQQAEMLANVSDAVIATDEASRITYWNRGAESLYGWRADDVLGSDATALLRLDAADDLLREIRRSFVDHGFWHGEGSHPRKDGKRVPVEIHSVVRTRADGSVYYLSVNRDVSERAAAAAALELRARQQEAVAALGLAALGDDDLDHLLLEAATVVAGTLDVPLCSVMERDADVGALRMRAGVGWRDGVVGGLTLDAGEPSLAAFAMRTEEAVIVRDLRSESRFEPPAYLLEHGVVSGAAAVVFGAHRPTGVILALATEERAFSRDDVRFLRGVAAVVGLAIERARTEGERRHALDRQLRFAARLDVLHRIDRDVLAAASVADIADQALEHLGLLVPYDRASVALLEPETGSLLDVSARTSDAFPRVAAIEGRIKPDAVSPELLSCEVLAVPDLEAASADTPWLAAARSAGVRSVVLVALRAEARQIGALLLSSLRPSSFDEEAVEIAREVGAELAVAIEQTRLREQVAERAAQLEQVADERQQMLRRIVRAQEEERERVALELHDGLGQILTSISLFASDLEEQLPADARPRAARVNELVRRAIADSRQIVWTLRPPELERLGLIPALRRLADETSNGDLTVDLHERIGDLRLTQEAEAVVYRVVQEAVHNARKHAGASAISILLRRRDGVVSTIVEDDGRGFDPAAVARGRSLGLIGMRERAELVDGELVVESAADAGTRVRLEVPVGTFAGGAEHG